MVPAEVIIAIPVITTYSAVARQGKALVESSGATHAVADSHSSSEDRIGGFPQQLGGQN